MNARKKNLDRERLKDSTVIVYSFEHNSCFTVSDKNLYLLLIYVFIVAVVVMMMFDSNRHILFMQMGQVNEVS